MDEISTGASQDSTETVASITFPTGKEHTSFSELKCWSECSYRHKLSYVDKLAKDEPSIYTDFGTVTHDACEKFLSTRKMEPEESKKRMGEVWDERKYDDVPKEKWPKSIPKDRKIWISYLDFLDAIPSFIDEKFPGWKCISAEEDLLEGVETSYQGFKFKGFVDGVLEVPKGKKSVFWIIDWKTTSSRGWSRDKKQSDIVQMQLRLYKHFWSKKHNVPMKDIRCGFVVLKRGAKKPCELITVSAGPLTVSRDLKRVRNFVASVTKGMSPKNWHACMYCEFSDTDHCKKNF